MCGLLHLGCLQEELAWQGVGERFIQRTCRYSDESTMFPGIFDQKSNQIYIPDAPAVIAFKCLGLALIVLPLRAVAVLIQEVVEAIFCRPSHVIDYAKDLLAMEVVAWKGVFDAFNAQKIYADRALFATLEWRWCIKTRGQFLAPCFQPLRQQRDLETAPQTV